MLLAEGDNVAAHYWRAKAYQGLKKYDLAAKDLARVVALGQHPAHVALELGRLYEQSGKYAPAAAVYERAAGLGPFPLKDNAARLALIGVLATCPDAAVRDGKRAVGAGDQGLRGDWVFKFQDARRLAAACAEAGDFDQAVKHVREAMQHAPNDYQANFQQRLELYSHKKPFHNSAIDADRPADP